MKTKIIKEEKNPFLERTEITIEIENKVSPSAEEVKAEIGKDVELTVIKKINTNFGRQVFIVEAVVYDNAEAKEKIETIPQKVRKKMAEEKKVADEAAKKAEETPAETTANETAPEIETPAEEKKEEPVTEKTKEELKAE